MVLINVLKEKEDYKQCLNKVFVKLHVFYGQIRHKIQIIQFGPFGSNLDLIWIFCIHIGSQFDNVND